MSFTFCFKGLRSLLVGTFVVQSPDHSHRRSKGKYYGIRVVKEDIGQHHISLASDGVANSDQGGAKSAMNRRGKSKDSGRRGQGAGREDDDEGH